MMILLIDRLDENAERLIYSLAVSEYEFQTVVIQYDGFLPEYAVSPYGYFIYGDEEPDDIRPLYFNQVDLPEYWEIQSNNSSGEIYDYEELRARLFYAEPKNKRYIRIIDWLDKENTVRCSDHFDKYGHRFAQTILDKKGKPVHKTYYDVAGREVITENLLTGDIILTESGQNLFFHTKSEFIVYFLRKLDLEIDRILYNSLAVPFFTVDKYCTEVRGLAHNVLFWQEPVGNDIPGNMKAILERNTAGTDVIAVQSAEAYGRICQMGIDQSRFCSLGFIYPQNRQNEGTANALVFTNSDQVEKLQELAEAVPEVQFHVGAITEMSSKLLLMAGLPNVKLFPAISEEEIQKLWAECDIYLDINHGGEILSAVSGAFANDCLILAFDNTLHNKKLVSPANLFKPEEYRKMAEKLQEVIRDKGCMDRELEMQRAHAQAAAPEDYRKVLG